MTETWIGGERKEFPSTRWDLIRLAASDATSLDAVARVYWKPLYFFARRKGYDNEAAKDLTQGFLALLLARRVFARADRRKGRFRSLLLSALENYMRDCRKEASRAKRGDGSRTESLDFLQGEREWIEADGEDPDTRVGRAWAQGLFAECVGRVESSPAHALALRLHLAGEDYPAIAARTGLSEAACRSAVHRLKGRFREILEDELASTSVRPEEVSEEIADFIELLR